MAEAAEKWVNLPVPGEDPEIISLYAPGGAMMGIVPLAVLARVEELTGRPITDVAQHMEGASVAGFLVAGMNVRKSNDPDSPDYNKPRYTMKEGLKLFVDKTPGVFPHIENRLAKMVVGQTIETRAESSPLSLKCDQDNKIVSSLCDGFNIFAVGLDAYTSALFSIPDKIIKDTWAKDYMYDSAKLEALYKEVLGEDTQLSDLRGSISIPAYNMTEGKVDFFTLRKEDFFDSALGNQFVSHGDPYLWEVAMAATANSLAYKPHIMEVDGEKIAFFDGAMFGLDVANRTLTDQDDPDAPNVTLVKIEVKPESKTPVAEFLKSSGAFGTVADLMSKEMPTDSETLQRVFGNSVHGFTQGGLDHVNKYMADMDAMKAAGSDPGRRIVIAPRDLQPNEDPASVPGLLESFTATPENIEKILNYADKMLADNDAALKDLAVELMANEVRRGNLTLDEYKQAVVRIMSSDYEHSEMPEYLESLKTKPDGSSNLDISRTHGSEHLEQKHAVQKTHEHTPIV
ncbi:MAG: hypothetical protein R3E13_04605 [Alphaproteobacteria bacterium]